MSRAIRVLVIDDSAVMRTLLGEILGQAGLHVVGGAPDAFVAWDKIKTLAPDVLTLDVEMPRMDGLSFLDKLMALAPMPVIMVSTFTVEGCATTLRALELGAVDFVAKPRVDLRSGAIALAGELVDKVKAAAGARVRPRRPTAVLRPVTMAGPVGTPKVIAVGASTGGTEALRELLAALPGDAPGVVVAQHMPEGFTRAFAERLDRFSAMTVREARDGDPILPGHVLIAPGDQHLRVRSRGATYAVEVLRSAPVNRHRPSVDVLFQSCAGALGKHAIGVIMTGMGADGAQGLLAMRGQGAHTFAQDEASCVVFGMPRAAIACGAVAHVTPLDDLAAAVLRASLG